MRADHLATVDQLTFGLEFARNLREVGALLPSSRYLGRAGAAYVAEVCEGDGPIRVLEAGAGTGSFTVEIIPRLQAGDRLDAFELNPIFCAGLQARLRAAGPRLNPGVQINLINGDLLAFPLDTQYDNIVSSLPLSNLPVDFVDRFLAQMIALLKPGGVFSYVQYAALGKTKYAFGSVAARSTIEQKSAVVQKYADQYQIERTLVWRNVPPTWVFYWQKPVASG